MLTESEIAAVNKCARELRRLKDESSSWDALVRVFQLYLLQLTLERAVERGVFRRWDRLFGFRGD